MTNNYTNNCKIITIGNEKGGAGKTTCSMHIITYLLEQGKKIITLDIDRRQLSLTNYLQNRQKYITKTNNNKIKLPNHFIIDDEDQNLLHQVISSNVNSTSFNSTSPQAISFDQLIEKYLKNEKTDIDYIIIDTPGSYSELSEKCHFLADIIITPINDSFIDLDVIAKINPENFTIEKSSHYSNMIFKQKLARMQQNLMPQQWFLMRNRLSNLYAKNKENMHNALNNIRQRLSFNLINGFSERVIFRELFLQGLTLNDLHLIKNEAAGNNVNNRNFTLSHIAAKQEMRSFINALNLI